jgi:hydroxyacylglutathione hydrolase
MKRRCFNILLAMAVFLTSVTTWGAAVSGDAEAATHGDEAASVQLVKETELKTPDVVFRQYNLGVLSHYSYLIGSGGEALIVDPARDIDRYLMDAKELGLKITKVYLTHSHADFVAGHMELAKATGAEILINADTKALYPHKPLKDNDEVKVGKVRGVVITTPGHTPDGTCMLVYLGSTEKPDFVFTGDTMFIGSVGRPDLLGEGMSAASLAELGYYTWRDKLSKIPDETKLYPAHGAGSLCGAHLSDKPVSTFGEQKRDNPYLQHKDLTSYVMAVIDGLPEAPQYFKHNAKMNHDGPALVARDKIMPAALTAPEVSAMAKKGTWLVDVRDAKAFAATHPQGAINIGIRGRFETWTGIMIPWGEPFVLIGSNQEVLESASRLKRIGYDTPAGFLQGATEGWKTAGLPVGSLKLVQAQSLHKEMQVGTAPIIVDVRLPSEWMALRIGNILNIPINKLFVDGKRLAKNMPVLTVCNSAYRSSMGGSVLLKLGFKDVRNMDGGSEAWIAAGLPTVSATGGGHGPSATPVRAVKLPDRIDAAELKRMIMDLPGTFEVVDVRPSAQFADFNLPGSMNVDIGEMIDNSAYLNGVVPLVIVDRDGSLAMAVGGILSQKTARPIKVLFGGLEAYWNSSGLIPAPAIATPVMAPAVKPVTPTSIPTKSASPAPEPPKRKSAGC